MDAKNYERLSERLQEKIDNGELTFEQANQINDLAYARYVAENAVDDQGDGVSLESVMAEIDAFLENAGCCKVCKGEHVVGAGSKSDTKVNNTTPVAKNAIEAHSSNATPDKGLGSKTLSPDILKNIELGDSQKEHIQESVNAMRLRVYDAFEAGLISEEDKENMLYDLDLNNYTVDEMA